MRIFVAGECAGLKTLLADAGHEVTDVPPYTLAIITRAHAPNEAKKLIAALKKENATLPILTLTAEGSVEERVAALESGADDALAVPFAGSQMIARVSALGRRAALSPRAPSILEIDGCFIDLDRAKAARDQQPPVALTQREMDILRYLHRHRPRAIGREELLEQVFEVSPNAETRSVDVAISVLRKKVERDPKAPRIVVSVKSVGYAWGESGAGVGA